MMKCGMQLYLAPTKRFKYKKIRLQSIKVNVKHDRANLIVI